MATPQAVPRRRWGIAFLLGFGVLVNYFDRVNLSVSQEALHQAFGISTVMFGYLLSSYSWTYAALQLPSGLILDRFGVKSVGRIAALLWSVASFAAAISRGFSDIPGERKSHRILVSGKRAEPCDGDFRFRGKVCIRHRRARAWGVVVEVWMAMEFCGHGIYQSVLFGSVYFVLQKSQ